MIDYRENIQNSGLSIGEPIRSYDDNLFIPSKELERLLNQHLVGFNLGGLPPKSRAKTVRIEICKALGYPIPTSFKRTKPRFAGQKFDVYTQQRRNVQVWNDEVDSSRRYVFVLPDDNSIISRVKVITGDQLASYDRTGTLTSKYQAKMVSYPTGTLFSKSDSQNVLEWCGRDVDLSIMSSNDSPVNGNLLKIEDIFMLLKTLEGSTIPYLNALQDRNRGAALHELICEKLGYLSFNDDGSYPDVLNQLLEIKLQTSPTIDLGLHAPNDSQIVHKADGRTFRSEDVRYVIADSSVEETVVRINCLHMVNGIDFIEFFPLFGGKGKNTKLQIPVPKNFFDED